MQWFREKEHEAHIWDGWGFGCKFILGAPRARDARLGTTAWPGNANRGGRQRHSVCSRHKRLRPIPRTLNGCLPGFALRSNGARLGIYEHQSIAYRLRSIRLPLENRFTWSAFDRGSFTIGLRYFAAIDGRGKLCLVTGSRETAAIP